MTLWRNIITVTLWEFDLLSIPAFVYILLPGCRVDTSSPRKDSLIDTPRNIMMMPRLFNPRHCMEV